MLKNIFLLFSQGPYIKPHLYKCWFQFDFTDGLLFYYSRYENTMPRTQAAYEGLLVKGQPSATSPRQEGGGCGSITQGTPISRGGRELPGGSITRGTPLPQQHEASASKSRQEHSLSRLLLFTHL